MNKPEIIVQGNSNGEGMVIRYMTKNRTAVYGLGIPMPTTDEGWDLGPTWAYLILGHMPTLIDTGRFGNYESLKNLLMDVPMEMSRIDRIIVTHSHEDHDGNLAEVQAAARAELWAHELYDPMISYHSDVETGAPHPEYPGSCRLCFMPEKLRTDCLPYHQKRSLLKVDVAIHDQMKDEKNRLTFIHTPGHTPDSICVVLEDEVIFTGDTLLPGITPHPSHALSFETNLPILPAEYRGENRIYGLMNYVRSLRRIAALPSQPLPITLPGHRLYYKDRFNLIHESAERANEIIRFHIDRCGKFLDLLAGDQATLEELTLEHFPGRLLKGAGKILAMSEVTAHLEILEESGDIVREGDGKDLITPTGTRNFSERLSKIGLDKLRDKKLI